MKFSIIVALYNKAQYIQQTLQSVLAQSYSDFEIIVIDDGSTDDGPQRVATMLDARIRLVRQANGGVSVARNRGIELARGEWIAFLDADDLWRADYLEVQVASIEAVAQADMVATGFHAAEDLAGWVANSPERTPIRPVELIDDLPKRWTKAPCFFTSSVAVRSLTLKALPDWFAVGESCGEDMDLWFRLADSTVIAFVPNPLVGYRLAAAGSLSQSHTLERLPPYLRRMLDRADTAQLPANRRHSMRRFVTEQKISFARAALMEERPPLVFYWLKQAFPAGTRHHRWWVTSAMVLLPGAWVRQFQDWRMRSSAAHD